MPIRPINLTKLGSVGIVADAIPWEIPVSGFSAGRNVRFTQNEIKKLSGAAEVYPGMPIVPQHMFAMRTPVGGLQWLVLGLEKAYAVEDAIGTWTNVTRQTAGVDVNYTGTVGDFWNGGILNGIAVVNNGVDVPQMWFPSNTSTKLQELTAWPSGYTARILRPYKYYLLAMALNDGTTEYPYRIRWSSSADPGTLPQTWDISDPTKDAGELDLAQDAGQIRDSLPMKDTNFIYREGSVWSMQWVGGNDIFRFAQVFSTFGILAQDCAVDYDGQHVVLTDGDLLVHNGVQAESIIDGRMRSWLFNNISTTYYERSFVVRNTATGEVWVCFPSGGSETCDLALVWNKKTGTLTVVELPDITFGVSSKPTASSASLTWAGDAAAWSDDLTTWDESAATPAAAQLVTCGANSKLLVWETTETLDGANINAYVEKTGITWGDHQGNPDLYSVKLLRNAWIRVEGSTGGVLLVEFGVQDLPTSPVVWSPAQQWVIGTTQKLDTLLSGRLFAIRISSESNISWRLQGVQFDVVKIGRE